VGKKYQLMGEKKNLVAAWKKVPLMMVSVETCSELC